MQKKLDRKYFLFMLPAILMVVGLRFFPIGNAFRMAFFNWNGYSPNMKFIGFDNFKKALSDEYFWIALRNTLIYAFGITIVKNVLGLALAFFVDQKFHGRAAIRATIYLPVMISGFIMGQIMYYFYQYDGGILNEILSWFNIEPVYWMKTGLSSTFVVLLTTSFLHCGSTMLLYLAGLQNIPHELLESARLDGASSWKEKLHITIPLLQPSMITSVVLNLIASFKIYDIISSLSKGGPDGGSTSLTLYISQQYFNYNKAGYAAGIAMWFFFVIIIISVPINKWLSSKKVEY